MATSSIFFDKNTYSVINKLEKEKRKRKKKGGGGGELWHHLQVLDLFGQYLCVDRPVLVHFQQTMLWTVTAQ